MAISSLYRYLHVFNKRGNIYEKIFVKNNCSGALRLWIWNQRNGGGRTGFQKSTKKEKSTKRKKSTKKRRRRRRRRVRRRSEEEEEEYEEGEEDEEDEEEYEEEEYEEDDDNQNDNSSTSNGAPNIEWHVGQGTDAEEHVHEGIQTSDVDTFKWSHPKFLRTPLIF